jgi:pantetheine-phosphate adenylyltransferase
MRAKFKHAVLGGTFDRLHKGHKYFIEEAEKVSRRVTIGLVTDKFLGNNRLHKNLIEPYKVRERELKKYLESKNHTAKTRIYPLTDIFGPALKEADIDMVLAIDESLENAKAINRERVKKGFPELKIVLAPMIKADDGGHISSKRIRGGEIDRNGRSYLKLFEKTLKLPDGLRGELRKPFGKVIKTIDDYKKVLAGNSLLIAAGDIAASNLVKAGGQADISIIDFKTQREPIKDSAVLKFLPKPNVKTKNEHSTINKNAVLSLNSMLRKSIGSRRKYTIEVDGEEDLLAIPAILLSPLGSAVIYGIREAGGIIVNVTEEKKEQVARIVQQFRTA